MVSNQVLGARLTGLTVTAGLLVLSVALSGCSSRHSRDGEPVEAPIASTQSSVPGERNTSELTATEAAIMAAPANQVSSTAAPPDAGIINPSAPKSYVVKRGDTLWGIASMFLRDPWLWPEVWYINPQVANPHLIYPGDTLALAYGANGQPQIRLERGGAARLDPRLRGDKVMPSDNDVPLNFIPSAPRTNVHGSIIAVVDGTDLIGQYQIVAINRGSRHGVVAGNIMAIDQAGDLVVDRGDRSFGSKVGFGKKVRLPEERAGTLLVFRTFDRLSYGLVVGASSEIHVADFVRNP